MKKFDVKSVAAGLIIGTLGITTAFAAGGIKSATYNAAKVTLDGNSVPLNESLVAIVQDGEEDAKLYMPVREMLEYLGYNVEFDSEVNTVKLSSAKQDIELPESPSEPNTGNIHMSDNIPEHFTPGGIAKTTQSANTYTYEGVIGADKYQFGNPFPANEGEQLTFTLNSLEYVSGEVMEKDDESILRVVLGGDNNKDNCFGFGLVPQSINGIAGSFPVEKTANYHITIYNYSGKEVKYSFTLTVK